MSDDAGDRTDETAPPDAADDPETDDDAETRLASSLTDDGIVLFFAGLACLLAAATAYSSGQPRPVVVFGLLAGAPALAGFIGDALSEFVPGTGLELLVAGSALVGAGFAAPGRYYINVATLGIAAALVGWRIYDVEQRDAERQ